MTLSHVANKYVCSVRKNAETFKIVSILTVYVFTLYYTYYVHLTLKYYSFWKRPMHTLDNSRDDSPVTFMLSLSL